MGRDSKKGCPMTRDEQLQLWLIGQPVHNHDLGECCPDFSCCCPELLARVEVRRAFVAANEAAREAYLLSFLVGAVGAISKESEQTQDVYIAGRNLEEEQ